MITGANSGVGFAAAQQLAGRGAQIVMVCRDRARGEHAQSELAAAATGAPPQLLLADLSAQSEIRSLAEEMASRHPCIDVLVNNAGGVFDHRELSVDGIEKTFATNHLAPFLLTHLLLAQLIAAPAGRVVTVSSEAYSRRLDFANLQGERRYSFLSAYSRSKLANVLFTRELARRLEHSGVTANAVSPGPAKTRFGDNMRGTVGVFPKVMKRMPFFASPARAARTIVYAAASPELEGVSGRFYLRGKEWRASRSPRIARRPAGCGASARSCAVSTRQLGREHRRRTCRWPRCLSTPPVTRPRPGAVARLAGWAIAHRRVVITAWLVAFIAAMAASHAAGARYVNNLSFPGTDSQRAADLLARSSRRRPATPTRSCCMPRRVGHSIRRCGRGRRCWRGRAAAPRDRRGESVRAGADHQVSPDGRTAFATVSFDESADHPNRGGRPRNRGRASARTAGLQVELGGRAIQEANRPSLGAATAIGLVAAIVVLLLTFGSAAAAGLPMSPRCSGSAPRSGWSASSRGCSTRRTSRPSSPRCSGSGSASTTPCSSSPASARPTPPASRCRGDLAAMKRPGGRCCSPA